MARSCLSRGSGAALRYSIYRHYMRVWTFVKGFITWCGLTMICVRVLHANAKPLRGMPIGHKGGIWLAPAQKASTGDSHQFAPRNEVQHI